MWWASGKPPLNPHPRKKMRSLSGAFSKGYRNHIPNGKCIIWLELPLRNLPPKRSNGLKGPKGKGEEERRSTFQQNWRVLNGMLPCIETCTFWRQSWSQVRLLIVEIEVADPCQNQKPSPKLWVILIAGISMPLWCGGWCQYPGLSHMHHIAFRFLDSFIPQILKVQANSGEICETRHQLWESKQGIIWNS